MTLRISDHALVRFLERAGGLDVDLVRASLALSLERSVQAAERIGVRAVDVHADGLIYVVRDGTLVTVHRAAPRRV